MTMPDSDSSDSESDVDDLMAHPWKTAEQVAAESQARKTVKAKRESTAEKSFEEEYRKLKQGPKVEGAAAAAGGAAEDSPIDLTSSGALICKALFEIENSAGKFIAELPTPPSFASGFELMQHQKQALAWMQDREEGGKAGPRGGILADEVGVTGPG
jgi:hypothetical protein